MEKERTLNLTDAAKFLKITTNRMRLLYDRREILATQTNSRLLKFSVNDLAKYQELNRQK